MSANAIHEVGANLRIERREAGLSQQALAQRANCSLSMVRLLEPAEVEAVAREAIPGPYQQVDRAMYVVAAMTGLRQGELIALRWRDVDWPAARIRVRQNYVLGEFGTPKSRRSTRSVPMADPVAAALDQVFKASDRQGDDDLVFVDPISGGPLAKAGILRRFRKALRAARLDDSHVFHDLRHTFGTRMAAAGVPMRTLQEWMGHRDIGTTQRYADYAPAHEAAMIGRAFSAAPSSIEGETALVVETVMDSDVGATTDEDADRHDRDEG